MAIDSELERLHLQGNAPICKSLLCQRYGVKTRQRASDEQLADFLNYLKQLRVGRKILYHFAGDTSLSGRLAARMSDGRWLVEWDHNRHTKVERPNPLFPHEFELRHSRKEDLE